MNTETLSVRFSSRHGVQQRKSQSNIECEMVFQSAFHRGMECNEPLNGGGRKVGRFFQSAFHRGMECNYVDQR